MVSETKKNDSFPGSQFFLDGFGTPFRLDRKLNGVGGGGGGVGALCFSLEMTFLQKLLL